MVRRTITMPEELERRVRSQTGDGESFSAAIARLVEAGLGGPPAAGYVGIADGGASDDSRRVEELVGEILDRAERAERKGRH